MSSLIVRGDRITACDIALTPLIKLRISREF